MASGILFPADRLVSCPTCHLILTVPDHEPGQVPHCPRCGSRLTTRHWHDRRLAAALALSALIFYFPAILLPLLRLERFGFQVESSLVEGVITLVADHHYLIGGVVLVFSLVLPPLKLLALLLLSVRWPRGVSRNGLHYLVELVGRWGMLDVLVVAVLVAFVKLGDLVRVEPGAGLGLFCGCVMLSVLSGCCLDLPALWNEDS